MAADAAKVRQLREALVAMRELAMVSYNGDPWYAEREKIDVDVVLRQAREALDEEPAS